MLPKVFDLDFGHNFPSSCLNVKKWGRQIVSLSSYSDRPKRSRAVTRFYPHSWDAMQLRQLRPFAEILETVLIKLYEGLDNPDFNLTVDMVPSGDEDKEYFRWHIRVLPRLSTPAGFEMGDGMAINTTMPEVAAAFLRGGDPR
jgi:hypothetical protein